MSLNFEPIVHAMTKLGSLEQTLVPLCKDIERLLIVPRLQVQPNSSVQAFDVQGDRIFGTELLTDLSAESLFSDLLLLIDFFHQRLPPSVIEPLSGQLMPPLLQRLTAVWLTSAVPEDLDGMEKFEVTSKLVQGFANRIEARHWPGKAELDSWLASVPEIWLKKRSEAVLARVRNLVSAGVTSTEVVERVETQMISKNDTVFTSKDGIDEWNAEWSDEERISPSKTTPSENTVSNGLAEEDDVSAWGFDDDKPNADRSAKSRNEDENVDAWGWGDDEDPSSSAGVISTTSLGNAAEETANGIHNDPRDGKQEQVTLREKYTITALPRELLNIVSQVSADCDRLEASSERESPLDNCTAALRTLPNLVLALFRASSSPANPHPCGNMLLYNDCLWLAEQLQKAATSITSDESSSEDRNALASALKIYGKRSYSKEMDLQRSIITDLLEGAQGFVNCTELPFNHECDTAVASTIDRIRQLYGEWKVVLSHSALLQAIGSLLSTVCSKMIMDIEDVSDISEPESQQLTRYCSRIAGLEDIFTPDVPNPRSSEAGNIVPLTAAYVSSWLKFQYLANILESSLADIKYLWTEEGLGLEFETEEVIDLIVALFAESPHRRAAINEIRAHRRFR